MLRPPVTPKKRSPAVPEQPEIPAAWLEALNNSGTTVAPANAGTVSPRKQFTNIRQAEQAIDSRQQAKANYNAYYDKRVPVKTIAPYMGGDVYSDSVGQMIKFAGDNLIKEPLKSMGRTLSLQNANTSLNPFSGASTMQRLGALGEDTLNVAAMVPFVRGASVGVNQAMASGRTARNQLATRMNQKFTPTASLDNYILHGGVTPDRLKNGILDPNYVRGGDLYLGDAGPSLVTAGGPNFIEDADILNNFANAENLVAGKVDNATPEKIKWAESFIDKHSEIVRRIKAGEQHQTGVSRLNPDGTYVDSGGNYVLDVPPNLRTTDTPAPAGEIKFWGEQKPAGFVHRDNPRELINKSTLQIMLDDADIKAGQTQKLANMIARARGTQITPAYKTFVEETFDKFLNTGYQPFKKDPSYGTDPRALNEYVTADYFSDYVPYVTNYDESIAAVRNAKTEKEIFDIIDNLMPNDQVDIALRQRHHGSTNLGFPDLKRRVVSFLAGINPEYSRLKSVPRNGPVVVNEAPYPKNLQNWDSLKNEDPSGQMIAFAQKFMDRRTPAEVIKAVYDEDLFRLMFKDPEQGQRIINERLSQLRRNQ
jgi:hypothetical protein